MSTSVPNKITNGSGVDFYRDPTGKYASRDGAVLSQAIAGSILAGSPVLGFSVDDRPFPTHLDLRYAQTQR